MSGDDQVRVIVDTETVQGGHLSDVGTKASLRFFDDDGGTASEVSTEAVSVGCGCCSMFFDVFPLLALPVVSFFTFFSRFAATPSLTRATSFGSLGFFVPHTLQARSFTLLINVQAEHSQPMAGCLVVVDSNDCCFVMDAEAGFGTSLTAGRFSCAAERM